jgi:hypothetical protein
MFTPPMHPTVCGGPSSSGTLLRKTNISSCWVLRSCPHQNGVVEVVAMQILVVVRCTRVLGPSLGRVDAQVRFPEQPLGQLDQPGSDGKQAQLGTREGKDIDSIELVIAVALVPRISGVIRSAAT